MLDLGGIIMGESFLPFLKNNFYSVAFPNEHGSLA